MSCALRQEKNGAHHSKAQYVTCLNETKMYHDDKNGVYQFKIPVLQKQVKKK